MRLVIRPGITGWAQVNGGTLLTANEKDALDEWYVQNASLWVDLRILMMTVRVMIWGQSRPHETMATRRYLHAGKELPALTAPQLVKRGIG